MTCEGRSDQTDSRGSKKETQHDRKLRKPTCKNEKTTNPSPLNIFKSGKSNANHQLPSPPHKKISFRPAISSGNMAKKKRNIIQRTLG